MLKDSLKAGLHMAYLAKRQFVRNGMTEGVRIQTTSGPVYATTEDLSAGGLRVLADLDLPQGCLCEIEFDLRTSLGGRPVAVKTVAKVVRSVQSAKGYHLGLQFIDLKESIRAVIQALSVDENAGPF